MTKQQLLDFESEIAKYYEEGKIHSPIHLHGGNEDELIEIFKAYRKEDWIFSTHRSHYHWLLSSRDPNELKTQILSGHSMHIFDRKFFTSAIVSGVAPIALGVAKALRMENSPERVWCFIGDMAGSGGLVHECIQYATGWDLPITYVVEDNCMSVRACTQAVWGTKEWDNKVIIYSYERKYPHAGSGKYVMF
jgi:pyruvate dehydrogenase E1 component alpha subunit